MFRKDKGHFARGAALPLAKTGGTGEGAKESVRFLNPRNKRLGKKEKKSEKRFAFFKKLCYT